MAISSTGLYDKKFQESMLAHLLRCPRLLRWLASGQVSQSDFSLATHKAIVNAAGEVLKVQNSEELISLTAIMVPLRVMIKTGIVLRSEIEALSLSLENIYSMELAPDFYENAIKGYLRERRLIKAIKDGNINDPTGLEHSIRQAIRSSDISRRAPCKPLTSIELPAPEVRVPTGILALDSRMKGGLGKGRFGLLAGQTGLGKTTFALNILWGAGSQGFRVAVISTEMAEEELRQRLYACAAEYPYDLIQEEEDPEFSPDGVTRDQIRAIVESRVREVALDNLSKMDILDYHDRVCTVSEIDSDLQAAEDRGEPYDMIVLDWIDQLEIRPSRTRNSEIMQMPIEKQYQALEKNGKEYAQLARVRNIAAWATTQTNRESDGKRDVGLKASSGSHGKSFGASYYIGIGANDEDRDSESRGHGFVTAKSGKTRNGRPFKCRLISRLDIQRFYSYEPDIEIPILSSVSREDLSEGSPIVLP